MNFGACVSAKSWRGASTSFLVVSSAVTALKHASLRMPKDTVRWRQQHDKNPRDGHGCVSTDGAMNGGTQHHDLIATASHWDLEQDYEQRPRKKRKHDEEDTRLPIITAEGRLERSHLPDLKDESGDSYVESDEDADGQTEEDALEDVPDNPVGSTREQIVEAKEELARIAGLLNEDPEENVSNATLL